MFENLNRNEMDATTKIIVDARDFLLKLNAFRELFKSKQRLLKFECIIYSYIIYIKYRDND